MGDYCNSSSSLVPLPTPRVETHRSSPCITVKNNTDDPIRTGTPIVIGGVPGVWVRDVCPGDCETVDLKSADGTKRVYTDGPIAADMMVGDTYTVNGVVYTALPGPAGDYCHDGVAALAGACMFFGICTGVAEAEG